MAAITGIEIGQQICSALGLDVNTIQEIHIHIVPDDKVLIETKQIATKDQMDGLPELFKNYKLTEIENNSITNEK